jgi:hypothetical protein
MSEQRAQAIKNRLAKIYGTGIVAFIAIFASITLLAFFFGLLN